MREIKIVVLSDTNNDMKVLNVKVTPNRGIDLFVNGSRIGDGKTRSLAPGCDKIKWRIILINQMGKCDPTDHPSHMRNLVDRR